MLGNGTEDIGFRFKLAEEEMQASVERIQAAALQAGWGAYWHHFIRVHGREVQVPLSPSDEDDEDSVQLDPPDPANPPDAAAVLKGDMARLPEALAQLSLEERVILRLRYVEEKSVAQVARALDKTDSQIRSLEKESVERLRRLFSGGDPATTAVPTGADGGDGGDRQLNFTVASQSSVRAGDSLIVDVFVHSAKQRKEVMDRVRESNPGKEIVGRTEPAKVKVRDGSILTVRLSLPGCLIDPPESTILWAGEIGNTSFVVSVPEEEGVGPRIGRAQIFLNGLSIGNVPFQISVGRSESTRDSIGTAFRPHRKAFASYASEDRDQVVARLQGMQKIAPTLEIFLDVLSLRSGEYWDRRLWEEIPKNDVFYLFWSECAAVSEWVTKEWHCALETKGIDFIDPVPLVSPERVKPPPELSGKHFRDKWLFLMNH